MLRLYLLTVFLIMKAATSDIYGSGDGFLGTDDEPDDDPTQYGRSFGAKTEEADSEDRNTMIIIVAAVCVVALAVVSVIAVVLFKRHLQRREQGVYSVPVEQGQKGV